MIAMLEEMKKSLKQGVKKTEPVPAAPFTPVTPEKLRENLLKWDPPLPLQRHVSWLGILQTAVLIAALVFAGIYVAREVRHYHATIDQLASSEAKRIQLESYVAKTREDMALQQKKIRRLSTHLQKLNSQAAEARQWREEAQKTMQALKESYEVKISELQSQFQEHQKVIQFLEDQIKLLNVLVGVSDEEASVPSETGMAVKNQPSVSGEIVEINLEYRFAIVTVGSQHGIKIGDFIRIYQENKPIGRARIDRIYPAFSAATILSEKTLQQAQKGDQVRLGVF